MEKFVSDDLAFAWTIKPYQKVLVGQYLAKMENSIKGSVVHIKFIWKCVYISDVYRLCVIFHIFFIFFRFLFVFYIFGEGDEEDLI